MLVFRQLFAFFNAYCSISITTHYIECHYAECHYAEFRNLFIVMLNVIILSFVMLDVVQVSVVMLNVVAPNKTDHFEFDGFRRLADYIIKLFFIIFRFLCNFRVRRGAYPYCTTLW
jgi:hypothetical protein